MSRRRLLSAGALSVTMALGMALGMATPALTTTASAAPTGDWVSVTQVMVNRLGGVNVSGLVSCAGTYAQIAAGGYQYQDENGEWVAIHLQPGDKVNLAANSDNYTVSQPSGRKTMIQVTHGSSRMNPCFMQYRSNPDGTPMPDWVQCAADGSPCGWQTDEFGYSHDTLPPLFDYASNGKFKAGMLSVRDQSIGLLVMIAHFPGGVFTGWSTYYVPEGSYATTSVTIKAVSYRS